MAIISACENHMNCTQAHCTEQMPSRLILQHVLVTIRTETVNRRFILPFFSLIVKKVLCSYRFSYRDGVI
jgi:hypothetical protein